ncbi:transposase [Methanoculleus sp. 10]|uniref:transposase n=1 Tax=Methanoculleus sp. 10 TaxID=430615 RepID=UPI0034356FC4
MGCNRPGRGTETIHTAASDPVEAHVRALATCHDREVLREYRRANPDKRLVLDTFSSHHAIVVGQYAAGNGIRLVHLPPYSPDRSPIEQVWRAIKRGKSRRRPSRAMST